MNYPYQLARYEADMNWQWSKYVADTYGAYSKFIARSPEQERIYRSAVFSSGFIPGIVETESPDWHCSYCGGLRPSATFRCEGCGASR